MTGADLIGLVGIGFVLATYLLVQAGRLEAVSVRYQVANMIGCLLIIYSLLHDFNLPSMVIQVVWFVISAFGLLRNLVARRRES